MKKILYAIDYSKTRNSTYDLKAETLELVRFIEFTDFSCKVILLNTYLSSDVMSMAKQKVDAEDNLLQKKKWIESLNYKNVKVETMSSFGNLDNVTSRVVTQLSIECTGY